jgi:hypothetical protein
MAIGYPGNYRQSLQQTDILRANGRYRFGPTGKRPLWRKFATGGFGSDSVYRRLTPMAFMAIRHTAPPDITYAQTTSAANGK